MTFFEEETGPMEAIYLEHWLHEKIKAQRKDDPDHQADRAGSAPGRLTRADVEDYQFRRLKKVLDRIYEKSTFYRRVFSDHNITPGDIRSLSDLARIPLTDPLDLAAHPNHFICGSQADITKVTTFTTSGTTGPQKRVFCTKADIERITDFMGAGLRTVAEPGDRVQIILPSGTSNNQGDLLAQGLQKQGIGHIKAGLNMSAEDQLKLIRRHRPQVLFGVTPRVYRMTQELERRQALSEFGVKTVFVTSGYLSESMRDHLRETWRADVHTHYGITEMGLGVAVECHAHEGYHFNEADLLLEVVDPETGEVLEEGEGELVFTTLTREGMPLIRYRTHDISHWINAPCPCGALSLRRIGKISRRLESGVKVGHGDEVYFSLFDEPLYRVPELVDYQIDITAAGGRDRLVVTAEVTRSGDDVARALKRAVLTVPVIRRNLAGGAMDEPGLELVGLGAFRPGGRAKKKITDHRMEENSNGGVTSGNGSVHTEKGDAAAMGFHH